MNQDLPHKLKPEQQTKEDKMIRAWLKKNKPSIIDRTFGTKMPHITPQSRLGKEYE